MSYRAIISCLLAIVFSFIFKIALSLFFSHELGERELLDPISNDWYINTFFTSYNPNVSDKKANKDIIIINLTDSVGSRGDIAEVIRYIASQHPKVMGIDIIFPENRDSTNIELLNAIADSRKETEIVVSSYWDDIAEEIRHSFFINEIDSINFGLVNQPNYTDLSTKYKGYPTFPAQVAKCSGIEANFSKKKAVNYRAKIFKCDNITNIKKINIGDIKGKIVLLGNTDTPSDIKNLPFYINGRNQLSGIEILAYQINTILASSKAKDRYQSPLEYNIPIFDFIICFTALYFYLFITLLLNLIEDSCNKWGKRILLFIGKFVFLILSECVIIWACFAITNYLLVIPDITLFVVSIIFVEEMYKKTPDISFTRIKASLNNMRMKLLKTFMLMLMLATYNVAFSQNYTLYSSHLPVEYQKSGKWYKVSRDETKLNKSTFVRCESDFTIQEIGGAEKLHFCSPTKTGKHLEELISTSGIKKIQTIVTSWFKSGSAYEIIEADSPTNRDSLDNTPYNLHYLLVDVHSFDDNTWGNLGLPNIDLDTLDHSIQLKMVPNGEYDLKTRKVLYSPQNTTADSIRWHLDDLVKQVNEDQKNLIILYLSSHGERSTNNEFCFITADSKYDFFNRGKITQCILGKEINDYVRQLVEKRAIVLVFLDACYAGTLVAELEKNDIIRDGSVAYFMSTEGDLRAYQDSNGSPFAEALIKALSNEEQLFFRGNNNIVSPYMLGKYIQEVVNTKHKGQNPKTERGKGIEAEYKLWSIKPKLSKNLIDDLMARAEKGDTDAMVELGDIYYKGNEDLNIIVDYSKAYNYYKVAFKKGNKKATAKVGLCYYYGNGPIQDYEEAFRYFETGSSEEDDLARYFLGVCYAKGYGTKVNKKKSKKTLLTIERWGDDEIVSAMEAEHIFIPGVEILNNDGFLSHYFGFDPGEKVVVKFSSGVSDGNAPDIIELRAENGDPKAQAMIGMIYLYGHKEKKINYDKAVYWLKKAEAAGIASAIYNLGYCYAKGFGVKSDPEKAWSNYNKAAQKGYSPAFVTIGNYYFLGSSNVLQNDRDAAENWKKAAEKGNIIGLYKLGLCYKYGLGVEQNEKESIRWITKSAKKGYDRAEYELGNYYFFNKDYKKAYKWFDKSKKQGNKDAKEMIDKHYYIDGNLRHTSEQL